MKASFQILAAIATAVNLAIASPAWAEENAPGSTEVMKWKDGKKAVFLLSFDDSAPSQVKWAIPELERRRIPGTFYLVTGGNVWGYAGGLWKKAAKNPYVVIANHTFTHKGVQNAVELEVELSKCNEVLYEMLPPHEGPRLLAFGKPGGVPWNVTNEEVAAALEHNHLFMRANFAGPPLQYHTPAETDAVVDRALAKGEMGHLDMHGVGGDWLVTPLDWFMHILDKLEANRQDLWLTDACSWHKYLRERETAEVAVIENKADQVRLRLTCKADPALYDEALTLQSHVPGAWANCRVEQQGRATTVPVRAGLVVYDAVPGKGEITLKDAPDAP